MPLRAAKLVLKQAVYFINSSGKRLSGKILGTAGTALVAPGVATATTGGTLAANTYTYSTTAVVNGVETAAGATANQVTTGSTSTVTITAPVTSGATQYKFYGRTTQLLLATQTSNVFIDTGAVTPAGAPPAAGTVSIYVPELQNSARLQHGVPLATTTKQLGAYQNRGL
jgi:hypothetical protein